MQVLGRAGVPWGPPRTRLPCLPPLGDFPTVQLIATVIYVLCLSEQFSLCLAWVSEIINPANTDVCFGRVTPFLENQEWCSEVCFKWFCHCVVARN